MRVPILSRDGRDVLVGTSGFSYPEWVESGFYPAGTRSGRMLELYSRAFPVVELNYTWYQMVRAEAMERMLNRVADSFFFTAKLTRTMTHEIDPDWPALAKEFSRGIAPLVRAGRLLAILVQLPPSFTRTPANREYLARLLDRLHPLPLAVEFRHRSWVHERVWTGLAERKITLVAVDVPDLKHLFPPLPIPTSPDLFYLRLHGRNRQGWLSGEMRRQFDYSYSESELRQWTGPPDRLARLVKGCRRGVIVFNNHVAGQAVDNARTMARILGAQGFSPSP